MYIVPLLWTDVNNKSKKDNSNFKKSTIFRQIFVWDKSWIVSAGKR